MSLFKTLSRMSRDYGMARRRERFDKLELERCLCTDDDDHFFAKITYYYAWVNDREVDVNEITASFPTVEISDRILMEECVNAARGSLKVRHWDVTKVERVIDEV